MLLKDMMKCFFCPAEIDNLIKNNQIENPSTLAILLKKRMKQAMPVIP